MKKCPFCEHSVSEAAILCPNCKRIISEPERTKKQKLKNYVFGAIIIIAVTGLAYALYFILGVTPVTAFVKGNIEFCSGIADVNTALLNRLGNEAFTADWRIDFKDVRYLNSKESGDFRLDLTLRKSKYDAAFASEYDFGGMKYNRQVSFIKDKNVYFGRPDKIRSASYMVINGSENIALSDRLPVLFTQFKTKEEYLRVWGSILTLVSGSMRSQYIHRGKGELKSRITGENMAADTIMLTLGREDLKAVFTAIRDKLRETPGAYDNMEKMFGYFSGVKSIRDIIENDVAAEIDSLPAGACFNWTIYQTDGKTVAAAIDFTGVHGRNSLMLQNEIKNGLNYLQMLLERPASDGESALHLEFDLDIENKGEYITGKRYGVAMKIDYSKGTDILRADLMTEAVLSQVSSTEYHTLGNALLKLYKSGREKTFDASYDFSYTFNEPTALSDSSEFPISEIAAGAAKVEPKAFMKGVYESYSSPFLLDDIETGK